MASQTPDVWKKLAQVWRQKDDPLDKGAKDAARILVTEVNSVLPFSEASFIHDIGTGNGSVIAVLDDDFGSQIPSSARLLASDVSPGMLDELRERQQLAIQSDKNLWKRVDIQVLDAGNLQGIEADSTSHILANYVLYAVDHVKALSEVRRTLTPDGVFGYTLNADAPWISLLAEISKVRPDKTAPYPPAMWHTAESNAKVLREAGFKDVRARLEDIDLHYDSYEGFVDYILDHMPFIPYVMADMPDDEIARYKKLMVEELKRQSPSLPGKMTGKVVVVTGRK
ncbi:S-adenosyl-L-methionine-dependent methyltransferase [Coniochaeta sp. PMI_546]|nr:S-adenosyl-L-methionine-dependent methyltransferase [Coniochaeta sp. PMI_546]